ncbi:MAG: cell division protein SepF [Clostridiales bacterium]|nr:cell division protein SepF [Clostridiales bacterium]
MSLFKKLGELVRAEDEYDEFEEDDFDEEPESRRPYAAPERKPPYGLSESLEPFPARREREPLPPPLAHDRRERERENVVRFRGNETVRRLTEQFKIRVIEPKAFDECPTLVDSLKNRTPVIINLESIENDTARKVFDFLSGATYALSGNVQKIAQNIFVFLPENVSVQNADEPSFKYGEEKGDPWRS